jgi:hypothetical protein
VHSFAVLGDEKFVDHFLGYGLIIHIVKGSRWLCL